MIYLCGVLACIVGFVMGFFVGKRMYEELPSVDAKPGDWEKTELYKRQQRNMIIGMRDRD